MCRSGTGSPCSVDMCLSKANLDLLIQGVWIASTQLRHSQSAKPVCPAHAVHVAPSVHAACSVSRRNAHAASVADLAQARHVWRRLPHGFVTFCCARETPHMYWLGQESTMRAPQLCIRLRGTCSTAGRSCRPPYMFWQTTTACA